MKKIMLLLIAFTLVFITRVNANTYTLTVDHDDEYFYLISDGSTFLSNYFPYYYMDEEVSYCIEPGKQITSWEYDATDKLPFDEETKEKLELISHYGYEYPGHNNKNYHIATQMLIWRLISNKKFEVRDQSYGYGNLISFEKEEKEIMRLVDNHYVKPSFDNNDYDILYGDIVVLEDMKRLLDNFTVKDDGGCDVTIKDNMVYITNIPYGETEVVFEHIKYDDKKSIFFEGTDGISQKQAILKLEDNISSKVNIRTHGTRIKVNKVDYDTNKNILNQKIKFKIMNNEFNEYICENDSCTFETNEEGYFITDKAYLMGSYSIYEVEDQDLGTYLWNSEKVDITISEECFLNNSIYEVNFYNKKPKGNLVINKYGEKLNEDFTYENIVLPEVKYGLYTFDDELVTNLITNIKGQAFLKDIPLGKYYLKELSSSNNNLVDEKSYFFEVKYIDKYSPISEFEFNFNNYLPKGSIEFIKLDSKTNEPIENTLIEIYYNDKLYYQGLTDKEGLIKLNNMPLGDYYLIEKESAEGYTNNNEEISFSLKEHNQTLKLSMTNDITIKVPNTFLNSYRLVELVGIFFVIISIGVIIYDKTQKK